MAENVPPGSTAAAAATADQPGRPYYENLRATLRQTIEKKRKIDDRLAAIEDQIFKAESAYLEETSNSGNIVRGFDGWVKGVQVGGGRGGADERRRGRVRDDERVFSRSSVSWMRVTRYRKENAVLVAADFDDRRRMVRTPTRRPTHRHRLDLARRRCLAAMGRRRGVARRDRRTRRSERLRIRTTRTRGRPRNEARSRMRATEAARYLSNRRKLMSYELG